MTWGPLQQWGVTKDGITCHLHLERQSTFAQGQTLFSRWSTSSPSHYRQNIGETLDKSTAVRLVPWLDLNWLKRMLWGLIFLLWHGQESGLEVHPRQRLQSDCQGGELVSEWDLFMNMEVKNPPGRFWSTNETWINVLLNFIVLWKLRITVFGCHGKVQNNPPEVLLNQTLCEYTYSHTWVWQRRLNIHMAVKFSREIWIAWDDPPVVNWTFIDVVGSAVIGAAVLGVTFIVDACAWLERFQEGFLAFSIFQTSVATAVNHAFLHSFEQHRLCVRVLPICPSCRVYIVRCEDLFSIF